MGTSHCYSNIRQSDVQNARMQHDKKGVFMFPHYVHYNPHYPHLQVEFMCVIR